LSSIKKRIFISFCASVGGVVATWYYFTHHYTTLRFHINEKPMAQVEKLENISRKKLSQHRTWQVIEFGESLYSGETIKTSSDSDLQIRFLETDALLNLEPDSLITISKNKNSISLNLLEGNLFVDSSSNDSGSALTLETSEGAITLTKASASFSKTKDSAVSVNVISGKASVLTKDGIIKDLKRTSVQMVIAEPKNWSVIKSKVPEIKLNWLGNPNIPWKELVFKVGQKRNDLTPVNPVSLKDGEAILPVRFGKNIVQVEHLEKHLVTSVRFEVLPIVEQIAQVEVLSKEPSVEVSWENKLTEETQVYTTQPQLDLKWQVKNPLKAKNLVIKIFDGESIILTEFVKISETEFKVPVEKPGRYLASIEAVDEYSQKLATTQKTIISQELPFLPKPDWDLETTTHQAAPNGSYQTQWVPVESATQYKLILRNKDGKVIKEWVQQKTSMKLNGMLPGEYSLSLSAVDQYQRVSPNSVMKSVIVSETSEILAPRLKTLRFK